MIITDKYWSQSKVLEPEASASSGTLLEMQILRPYPKSEILGWGPKI